MFAETYESIDLFTGEAAQFKRISYVHFRFDNREWSSRMFELVIDVIVQTCVSKNVPLNDERRAKRRKIFTDFFFELSQLFFECAKFVIFLSECIFQRLVAAEKTLVDRARGSSGVSPFFKFDDRGIFLLNHSFEFFDQLFAISRSNFFTVDQNLLMFGGKPWRNTTLPSSVFSVSYLDSRNVVEDA